MEVLDPGDRAGSAAALEALRTGGIEFFRAHRHGARTAAKRTGFCAWVRRVDLGGRPYAFARWVDPRVPPGPWPSGGEIFDQAIALALTDATGVARTAAVCPKVGAEFSVDDIIGRHLFPGGGDDNVVSLADWRSARVDGISIAYATIIRDRSGALVEVEAIATALAAPKGWLVLFVRLEPPASAREGQLEGHMWRIAAELEASGILLRAGSTPGLALDRIPDASSLSTRQWEVLRRIASGQRVPAIARELFVSQSTVRNHLSAIFARFGVHSQADLLARLRDSDAASIETDALPMA